MPDVSKRPSLQLLRDLHVLQTLAAYDHPLTIDELVQHLNTTCLSPEFRVLPAMTVQQALSSLARLRHNREIDTLGEQGYRARPQPDHGGRLNNLAALLGRTTEDLDTDSEQRGLLDVFRDVKSQRDDLLEALCMILTVQPSDEPEVALADVRRIAEAAVDSV